MAGSCRKSATPSVEGCAQPGQVRGWCSTGAGGVVAGERSGAGRERTSGRRAKLQSEGGFEQKRRSALATRYRRGEGAVKLASLCRGTGARVRGGCECEGGVDGIKARGARMDEARVLGSVYVGDETDQTRQGRHDWDNGGRRRGWHVVTRAQGRLSRRIRLHPPCTLR